MVKHLSGPGVQHGEESGIGPEVTRVLAQVAQGAGGGLEEQSIGHRGSLQEEVSQLFGYSRLDHVVRHGQQTGLLLGRPQALIEVAASRAGAVIATVVSEVALAALRTAMGVTALAQGAARKHGLHRPSMFGRDFVDPARLLDVGGPVLFEDPGEPHFPMIRSKRACWT
jgi:hypothetical protein